MHNSKKIIMAVVFCVLVILLNSLFNYIFIPPYYAQNVIRDLNKQKDIELLIIGDSLSRSAYDTKTISSSLNINAFNLNQTGCNLETELLLLEYTLEKHKVQTVILNWDTDTVLQENNLVQSYYTELLRVLDGLKYKIRIFPKTFELPWTNAFIYWSNMFSHEFLEIIKVKQSDLYKKGDVVIFHPETAPRVYLGQGAFAYRILKQRTADFKFSDENRDDIFLYFMDEKNKEIVNEIKDLCNKTNTNLIFMMQSLPLSIRDNSLTLKKYSEDMKNFFCSMGIKFVDANFIEEFNNSRDDYLFRDAGGHYYINGTKSYTEDFCNWYKKQPDFNKK